MAPRLQLLTWDVKDTLLRLRHPVGEGYAAQAQAHGLKVEAAALGSAFHQAYKAQNQKFPNYGLSQGLTSRQWWLDVVLQTFHLAGVQNSKVLEPIANKLYKDFSSAENWQMLEGAESTLQQCRERGLRLGVVSNFDRRLEDILAQCGLRKHFDFILTSEAAGCAKPDPKIFQQALQLADIEPSQAAHIGDHYLNDYPGTPEGGHAQLPADEYQNPGPLSKNCFKGTHPAFPPPPSGCPQPPGKLRPKALKIVGEGEMVKPVQAEPAQWDEAMEIPGSCAYCWRHVAPSSHKSSIQSPFLCYHKVNDHG